MASPGGNTRNQSGQYRCPLCRMNDRLCTAPALLRLGERAGVSRRSASRALDELAGASLDHLFVPKNNERVNDPKIASAFRGSPSVPDRHRDECQIGIEPPQALRSAGLTAHPAEPAA